MKLFRKVAIVGVGLIGGSIGLCLKKKRLCEEVVGVSQHEKSIENARRKGAVDRGSCDTGIIKGADLVILATPVETILELSGKIRALATDNCLITDVGSTKKEIVERMEKVFPDFIGSHPLAGSQKRGIDNATPGLFSGSICIITPTSKTKAGVKKKATRLWKELGAKVISMPPSKHDRILADVSHLPHTIAFSLANSVAKGHLKFAAGGFKDTTRIASSDSRLWADIFITNRRNILHSIDCFLKNLSVLRKALKRNDREAIKRFLDSAAKKRNSLT